MGTGTTNDKRIASFRELRVYQNAMKATMEVFEITKTFPSEEKFSIIDQIRKSSRSVCTNLAEAWRKRRYPAAFVAKISDAEGEACETQVWLDIARQCGYLDEPDRVRLDRSYDNILGQLVRMASEPEKWVRR